MALPGYLVGFGGLALITYRTLLAFGTTEKAITIQMNRFGEQYVDLLMLGVLWGICLVGLWSLFRVLEEQRTRKITSEHRSIGNLEEEMQDCFMQSVNDEVLGTPVQSFSTDKHGYVFMKNDTYPSCSSVSLRVIQENNLEE